MIIYSFSILAFVVSAQANVIKIQKKEGLNSLVFISKLFTTFATAKLNGNKVPTGRVSQLRSALYKTSGEVALDNSADLIYYGEIRVGEQVSQVVFDTGSTDLWVPGVDCGWECTLKNTYDPSKSKNSVNLNKEYNISYLSGSVSGVLYKDSVTLSNMSATEYEFGMVKDVNLPISYVGAPYDGIAGLSFQSASSINEISIVEALYDEEIIKQPVFCFYLPPLDNTEKVGELSIGEVDSTKYSGDLVPLKVITNAFWGVENNNLKLGSEVIPGTNGIAILDTGTSLGILPTKIMILLAEKLQLQGIEGDMYAASSKSVVTMPALNFTLANKNFTIEAKDYMLCEYDPTGNFCIFGFLGYDIAQEGQPQVFLLGDTFMRNFYSVHNFKTKTISLAPVLRESQSYLQYDNMSKSQSISQLKVLDNKFIKKEPKDVKKDETTSDELNQSLIEENSSTLFSLLEMIRENYKDESLSSDNNNENIAKPNKINSNNGFLYSPKMKSILRGSN